MNKWSFRGYSAVFLIAFILAVILGVAFDNTCTNLRKNREVEKWELTPEKKDGDFWFTFAVPENDVEGEAVAFRSSHVNIEVFVDGEMVYSLYAGNPKLNKSTGYQWNFVKLTKEDAGKEMSVRIIPAYQGVTPDNVFYMGDEFDIGAVICFTNGPNFLLAVLILLVGILLFVYSFFILEKERMDDSLCHFAIFAILLACWSILESPISDFLAVWPAANMVVDHYALMLMPTSFVLFIRNVFSNKNNKIWKVYLLINTVVIALRTIFQVTMLWDFKQTLWMTQLSIVLFAVIGIVMGIWEVRKSKISKQMKLTFVCLFAIFIATVLDLVSFQIFHKKSIFGMLGFSAYVIVMSVEMVKKSRKIIERAHETRLYRKLAYTDELTGAYNRTAFQQDIDSQISVDEQTGERVVTPNTIFMFDLNDLKMCNDTYGHENGDKYIKMVSEVLIRVIGIDGRCYRIGGDEFCAIMPTQSQGEIDRKLISIIREVQELDKKGFVVPISVAVGYAVYDSEHDETLEDTMKRADVLMYQNKQLIKKNRKSTA